jgi:circadian clock protein KaiC
MKTSRPKPALKRRPAAKRVADKRITPKEATNQRGKVIIRKLPTGVRGLDEILGGGIPEFSFNIIAGTPGCGKTTLAHQIVFANATRKNPALYFTVLGEPAIKMLRYQQQYSFYDESKLGDAIQFIDLSDVVMDKNLDAVLEDIMQRVKAANPGVVVVDSFRTVVRKAAASEGELEMQAFIQRLTQFLTSWQATTFLVGEYATEEMRDNPLFTVADGLFWLSQRTERNSVVRKLQIFKLRGQASVPGLHTFIIRDDGLQAYSRTLGLDTHNINPLRRQRRLSTGIPELDEMLKGGIYAGDSLLVAGPTGTGKSILAAQYINAGLRAGEPAVMAIFEERPQAYTDRAESVGVKFRAALKKGTLEILYMRPLELSVDQVTREILDAVARTGAKRLVIDSLVGLEMALAPGFREDFRESLYRMIAALTGAGVTILTTVEVEDNFTSLQLSHYTVSFLTDDIIRTRFVEIDGQLRKTIVVIKTRGGNHSKDIREYVITDKGVVVISPRTTEYWGLATGLPMRTGLRQPQPDEAAPEPKAKS